MYTITLKKNEERRIIEGHSWVYANEVASIEGEGRNGDLAEVFAANGRYLGKGFVNHASKILVRILSTRRGEEIDKAFFERRIRRANDLRILMGYDNCYRAVFAEADDMPALIVDKYADILCVQFLSLAMEQQKSLMLECLLEVFQPRGIYERSDVAVREKEGLKQTKGVLCGEFDPLVEICENGVKMLVDIENGQKTGYFLDQKENRFAIRKYAKGKKVLDCFSNSGGFSLNAALAGAESVTALDISSKALDSLQANAKLNGLSIDTVCCDVFDKLREYKKNGETFDLIVLDPPAFAKTASEIKDAIRGYKDINILALKLLREGGILASSSCSHYVTPPLFEGMLAAAARESGVRLKCLERRGQSSDHPSRIGSDETVYLKFYVLQAM